MDRYRTDRLSYRQDRRIDIVQTDNTDIRSYRQNGQRDIVQTVKTERGTTQTNRHRTQINGNTFYRKDRYIDILQTDTTEGVQTDKTAIRTNTQHTYRQVRGKCVYTCTDKTDR